MTELRLIRSDGEVPHLYWPRRARLLPVARAQYPTVAHGWVTVLQVHRNGDLWMESNGGEDVMLVRRCHVEVTFTAAGSPPGPR